MYRMGRNVYAVQFHPDMDTAGMVLRLEIYKDAGYFDAVELQKVQDAARAEIIIHPPELLRRFAERYGG